MDLESLDAVPWRLEAETAPDDPVVSEAPCHTGPEPSFWPRTSDLHTCVCIRKHTQSAFLCQSKQAQVPTKARPSLGYLCSSALQGGVGSKGGQVLILQGTRF